METREKRSYTYECRRKSNLEIELKRYCRITRCYNVANLPRTEVELVETQILKFEEATQEEIVAKRCQKEPGIIMVYFGQLFFTKAPKYIKISRISEIYSNHKCAQCIRLSAKSDEQGGCQKVRDWPIKFIPNIIVDQESEQGEARITKRDIINSMRIEKYPFVTFGMESINTNNPELLIAVCENYKKFN